MKNFIQSRCVPWAVWSSTNKLREFLTYIPYAKQAKAILWRLQRFTAISTPAFWSISAFCTVRRELNNQSNNSTIVHAVRKQTKRPELKKDKDDFLDMTGRVRASKCSVIQPVLRGIPDWNAKIDFILERVEAMTGARSFRSLKKSNFIARSWMVFSKYLRCFGVVLFLKKVSLFAKISVSGSFQWHSDAQSKNRNHLPWQDDWTRDLISSKKWSQNLLLQGERSVVEFYWFSWWTKHLRST